MKTRKKILATVLCIGALGVFAPRQTQAQSISYVSNTGESTANTIFIGSNQWIAAKFTTGADAIGYNLDSIQFLSGGADNQSDDFSLSLYADNSGNPGTSLDVLSGTSNPSAATIYDYSASGITLSPSTAYWVVVKTETPVATLTYTWAVTGSSNFTSSDGWSQGNDVLSANDGSTWSGTGGVYQFGVTAEPAPAPEPGTFTLAALGLSVFFLRRKK